MQLSLNNIKFRLGKQEFFFNFQIKSSITGIFGTSGSGKTTLLNLLAGLIEPIEGEIVFNNKTLFSKKKKANTPTHRRQIGVVFQENNLFPHLSIKQNLEYAKAYRKQKELKVDFETVIKLLDINDLLKKKPSELSGGERQRVAIGRALLSQPKLLLLDEPFSNLDYARRKRVTSYLLKINNQLNIPLLIISHDLEDILRLTDQLILIENRTIKAIGKHTDLVKLGKAPELIAHKAFLNVFDGWFIKRSNSNQLCYFAPAEKDTPYLAINSGLSQQKLNVQQSVRFCIAPDDIAISLNKIEGTSIQNQIQGTIIKVIWRNDSYFVFVDCGFEFVSEVTKTAIEKLNLKIGKNVFCLIKSKAIEMVHIFSKKSSSPTITI